MFRGHHGNAAHREYFLYVKRKSIQQFEYILRGQQSLAETEKPFHFAAALFRSFGFAASAFCEVTGHECRYQKGEQRHPVLRIGNGERSDGR